MRCLQCGQPNPQERLECQQCGEPLLDALSQTGVASGFTPTRPPESTLGMPEPQPTLKRGDGPDGLSVSGLSATLGGEATGSILGGSFPSQPTPGSTTGERTLSGVFGSRYEILQLIGEGGMGRVYRARDRELDKIIALKTIRTQEDVGAVSRFKKELILARKITHKNVVRIFDLGEAEGIKFFTMEFIEGDSLKALIRRRGKIPPGEAIALSRQILGALHEAHEEGVVHRDLKPQNIMVDTQGVPHLMDFGIARSLDTDGDTVTGAILGTPDYMSPEQVRGEKAERASDIFSFGVILYEMLTGDIPYHGDTPISKIMMRLNQKPRAPHELTGGIPKYLEGIVLKCMEVDPVLRYPTVSAILDDIEREHVDRSVSLRVQRAVGRHRRAVAAAAVLGVAALGVGLGIRREAPPVETAAVAAGSLHTLAIVPFTNATGSGELEWMRTGLADMLVTDLSQSKYVRPVPGERVSRVLQQAGLSKQSRFDEAALESVSKLARAQSVLSGQFVEAAGKLRLDLTLRRAGSGVAVPLKAEGTASDVFAMVDRIAQQVREHLDLSPEQIRSDTARPVAEVSTGSLEALRAYHAGLAKLEQGANQAALPLLKEATTRDPSFAMAFAKLASAYLETGDPREAGAAIERAQALADQKALPLPERYQIHATAALVKDDFETAVGSYTELAKLYPDDPDIQLNLANALQELGKLPEAISAYQRVLGLAPTYSSALLELGRVQFKSGHFQEAIRTLQDGMAGRKFSDDPETLGTVHSILGVCFRDSAQPDKALEHLNLSLDFRRKAGNKRGQSVTLTNLASVYENRGEIDKALEAERRALAISREMGDRARESFVLNNMGLTYRVAGNLDKALLAFRESLQIENERQDHKELANRLDKIADVYRLKGQYDDALVYLEQAKSHLAETQEKEEKAINLHYIALVRKAQGLYDQALEAFLAAQPIFKEIEQEMGVAMVHHDVAEIYANQGRYADAHEALEQSLGIYTKLEVKHDIAEVKAPLGHLLATLGLTDAAGKELADAARVAREAKAEGMMPEILLGQAEVAHLKGKHEEAAKLFEDANVRANVSGQKEVAVESRIELGHLYLEQGKLDNALGLLLRTREEAQKARLRPLESEAAVTLARVYLARKDAGAARKQAMDATAIAEKFSGRPMIHRAQVALGEALEKLGREAEALDAYAKAATALDWIRGSLKPEHVGPFMAQSEVQDFLRATLPKLEKGGRAQEAAALKKWVATSPALAPPGS
jgi:eukaryotic-like serine/threonine-protein kinase